MSKNVAERLRELRESLGLSQRQMSTVAGLSSRGWQKIESGLSIPGGQTLMKLMEYGFNPAWILTGHGLMTLSDVSGRLVENKSTQSSSIACDPELLSRINGIISRVYTSMDAHISPEDMGRLAAGKYASILQASSDPAERLIMAKLFEIELKQDFKVSGNDA
ncbi:helix-turn-helix domain-containing protein [Pseudochelatococcus sp. G4_1912]|uniref:helix-turn-helix domain-containing protein n=1 Tax=Pseudochelatococcus sp. G4_1912 TaxID=3114288 RepID=UPI0039C6ADD8